MTATQEIENWKNEFSTLTTDAEKEAFKAKVHASMATKNEAEMLEGLKSLKSYAKEVREKAESLKAKESTMTIKVYPKTKEDISILKKLLARMDIPFSAGT